MNIYLVRHAETQENIDGIVQGWMNTHLTQQGKIQATAAAEDFNKTINMIYCSDLKRCTQTAEPFTRKYPTIPYHTDTRLRERYLGDAQGQHWSQQDWNTYWSTGNIDRPIANAESFEAYTTRLQDFLVWIKNNHSENHNVLLITHGGVISRLLEITNTTKTLDSFKNTAVTAITIA